MNKIFRNVNVKLYGVIGIIILLFGALAYEIYFDKPQYVTVRIKGSPGNWWWVTPRPPDFLANAVKVGDKEFNAANRATAEVLEVDVYDAGGPTKDVFLTVKLEAKQNSRTKKYSYKGEPLHIGGPISLNLDEAFFPGMVVEVYGVEIPKREYVEKQLKIKYENQWPFAYDAIVVGDTIKDGNGNVIAEIIQKERRPAEKEGVTLTGQIVKTFSPVFEDYFVTVKVKAIQKNEELIFREEQYLKVNNKVWLMFPHINMAGAYIMTIE